MPGHPQERVRWRQLSQEGPFQIYFSIPIPEVVETYYECAGRIDRHNRSRQSDIDLDRSFRVQDWSTKLNSTLLAVCIVYSWLLFKGGREGRSCMKPDEY